MSEKAMNFEVASGKQYLFIKMQLLCSRICSSSQRTSSLATLIQQISLSSPNYNPMVLVHFKKSEKNNFIIQCPGETPIHQVLRQIIEINNLRIYLDRLIWSTEELANKGVLKPLELQGVSHDDYDTHKKQFIHLSPEILAFAAKPQIEAPYRFVADKHNQRYGVILPEELKVLLINAVGVARKTMLPSKQIINLQEIVEAVQVIRQAVMNCYPAYIGLPEWEPTLLLLEEKLKLDVLETQDFQLYEQNATIWWAGRELEKDKCLHEYSGKNEKTKIIVRVQKFGGQQPPRQPPVDTETYQKMVKFYYKKVEETKEFQKHSVESHYDKVETGSLKAKLHLEGQDIKYKPF